jgi:hypothetical protein
MTTICPVRRIGMSTFSTEVSKTREGVAPSTASEGPIPSKLMLESSVVFLPRLRGTESRTIARPSWARRSRRRSVPMKKYASRTRPRRRASAAPPPPWPPSPARSPSQTPRAAPWRLAPLFPGRTDAAGYGAPHGGATHREPRHDLYVLAALPKGVTKGRSWRSSSSSFLAFSSSFARDPGFFFIGARGSPRWALLT